MKILFTGHKGFVGKAACKELEKNGHEIIGYDLPESNLMDASSLQYLTNRSEMVVHCAAIANLYDTAKNPSETYNTNVTGTYNVMRAAKKSGTKVVYISTCCVYGPHIEAHEQTLPNPVEFYAKSKLAGEVLMSELGKNFITLRLGTVYGPGMRKALFNYKILEALKNKEFFYIFGDGTASRNYIYIDDLADGINKAVGEFARNENIGGKIFNLCGTEITTLDEVVEVAEAVSGCIAMYNKTSPRSMGDYGENISNEKARRYLGWRPNVEYYTGMKYTWEWINENTK